MGGAGVGGRGVEGKGVGGRGWGGGLASFHPPSTRIKCSNVQPRMSSLKLAGSFNFLLVFWPFRASPKLWEMRVGRRAGTKQ